MADLNVMPSSRLLVGVSGGVDSMVLVMVMHELSYSLTAAHVNFQLRGKESDDDASLVKKWCSDHHVSYLENVTNAKQYAVLHKLNTQSAAREIRYNWWETLVETGTFDFVATAHHRDDNIETLFLNLLRGTGLKGLRGIPAQRDYFIRPMIDVSRVEIESFASNYDIPFRSDSSNESDDYQRNRIRHHLIPLLHDLNPDFDSVMKHALRRMEIEWKAWDFAYQLWQKNNAIQKNGGYDLKPEKPEQSFLLRWLEEKGIPWSLTYDFISSPQSDSGKVLDYRGYRLSRTAAGFYFEKIEVVPSVLIPEPGSFQIGDNELSIELVSSQEFIVNTDPWIEYADLSKITWPLELRPVMAGDHFQPLGMMGKSKKIQDYLVDLKLDHYEKKHVRVLKSPDQILWLVGKRLDERIKVKPGAIAIYRLRYRQG